MAVNKYITLANSSGTLSKKFRVVQEGYDDGTWNRNESVRRQMGGGIDHSYGDNYRTWRPVIKVRHTESLSGYGTLSDLETLWKLNNPNGTPTNVISFTDHHGTTISVHFVEGMSKQALGCSIEGAEAWFLYQLSLMEVA